MPAPSPSSKASTSRLRKVGGGYIFIHRMLLEYFATQYDKSSVKATPNAEPSQIAIEM
ncbi:MAG: hypothetical protein JOZ63_18970 [Planctomycetaceae bacterium]|nr:hypothetical protein [Planctomycetaceae bacterium]